MTDQRDQHAIDVLKGLYALEQGSLVPHLGSLHNFVSWLSADQLELVKVITAEEGEHQLWLLEMLQRCGGGGLSPVSPDAGITSLHYLELHAVMPLVRRSVERLVEAYGRAASDPALPREVVEVIDRIRRRHEAHVAQLRKLETAATGGKA